MNTSTPVPFDRACLDQTAAHGCHHPDCAHQDYSRVLWMNQRCHTGAPKFLERRGNVVTLICADPSCAQSVIVEFQSTGVDLVDSTIFKEVRRKIGGAVVMELLEQACHDTSAVQASYEHGSGVVKVFCYHCDRQVATVKV